MQATQFTENRMQNRLRNALLSIIALVSIAGCASNPEPKVWRDPNYAGGPLKKLFVIGLSSKNLSDRRGFEDLMVSQVRAAGGQAVPGYQFIPPDAVPDQATIRAAVGRSGADGVLISRITGFQTYSDALQNPDPGPDLGVGQYSALYGEPGGGRYQVATIYTTLFATTGMSPIFTYDPKTFDPHDFQQQAPAYASQLVAYLQSNGFLMTQLLTK